MLASLRPRALASGNDANIFIGSSNIGDGAGRQLWNFKDGTLRGDRPHMLTSIHLGRGHDPVMVHGST